MEQATITMQAKTPAEELFKKIDSKVNLKTVYDIEIRKSGNDSQTIYLKRKRKK